MKVIKRKVTKMGNSSAITLPKEVLESLDVAIGDELTFNITEEGTVKVEKVNIVEIDKDLDIGQDFMDNLYDVLHENEEISDELSKL